MIHGVASDIAWTPDGRRIAYLHSEWNASTGVIPGRTLRLFTIRPDGRRKRLVATLPAGATAFDGLSWTATG